MSARCASKGARAIAQPHLTIASICSVPAPPKVTLQATVDLTPSHLSPDPVGTFFVDAHMEGDIAGDVKAVVEGQGVQATTPRRSTAEVWHEFEKSA